MPPAQSTMLPLGSPAPAFDLPDTVSGSRITLHDARGEKGLVVMFICNHCPFVVHVATELAAVGKQAKALGLGVVAISSNNIETHPADAPDKMAETARANGYGFAYCYDEDQSVARAFRAACTPDFFVFDGDLSLAYRGQLDDSRPSNGIPVTGADLRAAIEAVAHGKKPSTDQKPSIGCGIKWKPGNEPA